MAGEKLTVKTDGADIELQNYERLFELIYLYGSNNIAKCLARIELDNLKSDDSDSLDISYCITELKEAFGELKAESVLILEKMS